jgi:hypothetical protein
MIMDWSSSRQRWSAKPVVEGRKCREAVAAIEAGVAAGRAGRHNVVNRFSRFG